MSKRPRVSVSPAAIADGDSGSHHGRARSLGEYLPAQAVSAGGVHAACVASVEHARVGGDSSVRLDAGVNVDTGINLGAVVPRRYRGSGDNNQQCNHGSSAIQRPS